MSNAYEEGRKAGKRSLTKRGRDYNPYSPFEEKEQADWDKGWKETYNGP